MRGGVSFAQPVLRLADGVRALSGWRRYLSVIAAGAFAALALPPADVLPALWIAIPILIWQIEAAPSRAIAFWIGWCFGFGYLAISLYWMTFSLFVAIDRYWWLVPFASNGLAAGLAIYWGIAGYGVALIPRNRPWARALASLAAFTTAEWLRGTLLSGFPWNLPGYAWTDFPWLIQLAAWIGIYGVTLVALSGPAAAALLGSRLVSRRQAWVSAGGGLALVAVVAIAGAMRLPGAPTPLTPGVNLRLVQPSIPQALKWAPGRFAENLRRQVALSLTPAATQPTAIVWSEAAEPYPLDDHPDNAKALAEMLGLKPGQLLITGIGRDFPDATPPTFRDSIQALDSSGQIVGTYDKFHYVPFGEYMPLRRWLPLDAVAAGGVDPAEGPGPVTLDLPGLPPAGPLICYEVIFPHEVVDEGRRPAWLLDVTNDAWFGITAGPHQHFSMMRVRAVEEGLPLVNAANDGVSGVIDPYGRVVAELGLGKVGVVDSGLPRAIEPTLYARLGDGPFFALLGLVAIAAVILARRPRQPIV